MFVVILVALARILEVRDLLFFTSICCDLGGSRLNSRLFEISYFSPTFVMILVALARLCGSFHHINYLKNILMRFAHDSLQLGVPAFHMIVCSWPIVVVHVVVPLLESELAIDPGTLEVRDKVFDNVRFWGFLLNS